MQLKRANQLRVTQVIAFTIIVTIANYAIAYDPVDCLNDLADLDPEINMGSATRLCSYAWTSEPIACYLNISKLDSGIPRGIAIDLCAGTINSEKTLQCYSKAGDRKMNRSLATTLCGARKPLN